MGNETELNLFEEPEQSNNSSEESSENSGIEPLKEIQDEPVELAADVDLEVSDEQSADQMEESQISIDEHVVEEISADEPSDGISTDESDSMEFDLDLDDLEADIEASADDEIKEEASATDGENGEVETLSEEDTQTATAEESDENDFLGLNDDDIDESKPDDGNLNDLKSVEKKSEKSKPEKIVKKKKNTKTKTKSAKTKTTPAWRSLALKTTGLALVFAAVTGIIVYTKPSLFKAEQELTTVLSTGTPPKKEINANPISKIQKSVPVEKAPQKHDLHLAKLKEAARLRDKLLEKKDEIYKLKIHLQNGIAELEDETHRETQRAKVTSFAQAVQNKRIELNLRTIQRRQNYIRELEKPARWARRGSEELLYLKRKAELDMAVMDIADNVDMDRHMRYISAAIQKYRPSAEKLAVHPQNSELLPLETIWSRIKKDHVSSVQIASEGTQKEIIDEICSGYFHRTSRLTSISDRAAKCLAKMKGSDLFLNGLTKLSPPEAKFLFQWPGSWVCLNGLKELSPETAKYLFKWDGKWISLNGLTEFPPELARYLMKWNGNQLELMGLKYDSKKADKNGLKYLALWETMGGKLFIPDDVRKKMKRLTM